MTKQCIACIALSVFLVGCSTTPTLEPRDWEKLKGKELIIKKQEAKCAQEWYKSDQTKTASKTIKDVSDELTVATTALGIGKGAGALAGGAAVPVIVLVHNAFKKETREEDFNSYIKACMLAKGYKEKA